METILDDGLLSPDGGLVNVFLFVKEIDNFQM